MKRLALLAFSLLCYSGPAISADLDGPVYRERETVIERPLPPRVVEKRIIEHHYYEPAPVYERRIYVEPRAYYVPREYGVDYSYYARPYRYAYAGWRPRYFFPRERYWHRHHHW